MLSLKIKSTNARYFQIACQLIFLSYGIYFLHWNADTWLYTTYFLVSIATQFCCEYFATNNIELFWQKIKNAFPSVCISSLGLCLLLKTNSVSIAALAAFISIASKFILKINGKHIFNPSALGIVLTIVLTGKAWFSPGQWGSGAVILFATICLGIIVTTKVQQIDVSIAFLGTYAALLFARQILFLNWPLDFFVQSISTGSLILFSFFMITDPKTTPNNTYARIIWAILIAIISFYVSAFMFINGAPIFVLVIAQLTTPFLDMLFKKNQFHWNTSSAILRVTA